MEINAFHVVSHDALGNVHLSETVKHTNEQIFLFGIEKEFYKDFPTMMADHGKASNLLNLATLHIGFRKAPVHLVCFAWLRLVTEAAGFLKNNKSPFNRNKVMMLLDIPLHLGKNAIIPRFRQSVEANLGVGHSFFAGVNQVFL